MPSAWRAADSALVIDDPRSWKEHRPTAADENRFIARRGCAEYSLWYLGIDDDARPDTKRRYKFPQAGCKRVPPTTFQLVALRRPPP
jgi:hypothetical protein